MGEEILRVRVRFFGHAAELAGCRESVVGIGEPTVAGVADSVRRSFPALAPLLDGPIRFAVGTEYAPRSAPVREGDVVSLLPPVGGG